MKQEPSIEPSGSSKLIAIWGVILVIIVGTALIAGGEVYWWQKAVARQEQQKLQQQEPPKDQRALTHYLIQRMLLQLALSPIPVYT